ncbi:MAG: hypothetical protein NT067_04685 [Candidatus Diapherotrites archaeon]|nr:hypothetical protein [Candidatus Diapherotrites archaeon]
MSVKGLIAAFFRAFEKARDWAESEKKIYATSQAGTDEKEKAIGSLWDFLAFTENTQAFHLVNVIGFEEWVDMEEIRRRIKEIFAVEYKNEKSLYPYLKTLADISLFESTNIGGRRKWRKKELLFELEQEKEGQKSGKKEEIKIRIQARESRA